MHMLGTRTRACEGCPGARAAPRDHAPPQPRGAAETEWSCRVSWGPRAGRVAYTGCPTSTQILDPREHHQEAPWVLSIWGLRC